jgi:cell wall-associated NlpC family hydrolase
VIFALIGVLCATLLLPLATLADTNLVVGGKAVIAYANGDQVRLRQDIGYEATLLANYSEGTVVTVEDGPFTDSAGNYWYKVTVDTLTGYIVADYLALESGVPLETIAQTEEEAPAEAATEPASAGAAGVVIGLAYVAGTNGDGVRCRTGAASTTPVITVLPEGSTIELTGVPVDGWQPINCAGVGGFVSEQFVSYNPPTVPEAAPAETSGDEVATEEPASDQPASDQPAADQPATDESAPADDAAAAPEAESETSAPVAGTITGKLIVTGTNGDGVRCRAKAGYDGNVITILPEGSTVDLNGGIQGEWQPVYCGGTTGYVFASFLAATPDNASTGDEGSSDVIVAELAVGGPTATATVSGTNGDGVRCRNAANYTSATITVLAEGTAVAVRGDAQGDFLPVTCGGQNGFAAKAYLSLSGAANAGTPTAAATTGAASSGSAVVKSSGGLNCRSAASMSASVITVLANGATISLRSGSTTGWQAVLCNGQNGFAASEYLTIGSSSGSTSGSESSSGAAGSLVTGASMKITGTGGGGLRLRSAANYNGSVLSVIGEGATVTVRSGSTGEWVAVSYNGTNGFVHKDFVSATTGSTGSTGNTTNPGSTGSTTTALANGDHARVTSSLNLRYSASYTAGVAAVAPAGTVVKVTGSASSGFYPVSWDGLNGFMHGDYLTKTTQALSERGGSAAQPDGSTGTGNTQTGSASGNSIVSYAMRYIGYPYVWAAAGPSAFDCSGFIYWVVTNSTGKSIGRVLTTQISAGRAVSQSELQPGDLVFFQNTYQAGLSHGGIYIGNGQFIHASNPSTGVMISTLSSSYYASRWYGAVRLG